MSASSAILSAAPQPGGAAQLGDRSVARVGFGAMQLERLHADPAAATALVRHAVELGVDHIDTAQFYGDGFANSILREALADAPQVAVVSKVGADPNPGAPIPLRAAQRPEELRASVEDNLRSLGVDQLEIVNLRRIDPSGRFPLDASQHVDFDDQVAAMVAMRDEGLIAEFGLSTVDADQLRQAIPAGIACVQNEYSLIGRRDEALLELCAAEGIAWVPYFPLGSAFPGMPKVTDESSVREVAESSGFTASQIGLAWLLHHAANVLLIPGTASHAHLGENTAAGAIRLDDEAMALLDATPQRAAGVIG